MSETPASEKLAVVLFNLGGPDSPAAIRPFLRNFFTDPNIIGAPWPIRRVIAELIARRRSRREAGQSYGELGGRSPLLANTEAQARALEAALGGDARVFVAMRYWHPMADAVAASVKAWGPDRIVLLPLYPQFSTTTTRSSLGVWKTAAAKIGLTAPTHTLCCYPGDEGFIAASAASIRAAWEAQPHDGPRRLLFSAHGLPQKTVDKGDPYQWQCEATAAAIAARLTDLTGDWQICYQSRVGPLAWIGPSIDEALQKAAADKVAVLVYPHAFTQEHVETLVELDIEYRHRAEELGVPGYARAGTVDTRAEFIQGLAGLVRTTAAAALPVRSAVGPRLCPDRFGRCCQDASA